MDWRQNTPAEVAPQPRLFDILPAGRDIWDMLLTRNRNYRLLFSATAVSNLGDGISALAFPWLATLLTRDPLLIGLVAAAGKLPWLLFAIPAGAITDRADRRALMVRADVFRLLLTVGVIALILSTPALPLVGSALPYILALSGLAFLLGSAEVLRDNAAQTVLPSIVPKTDLENANGQLWSVEQITGQFIGPPVAGFLIALAIPLPFGVDAVTFALAAWLVWCIALPKRPPRTATTSLRAEMAEGWAWMKAHPLILQLALMLGIVNFVSIMGLTILVLYSQEILGLGAAGHGILLTAGAAGGVVGGLICPPLIKRLGTQRGIWLAMALFPLPFVTMWLTSNPWIVAIALFVEMIGALQWNVITVSLRQRVIPDELLGRVNSLYRFFGWGAMPLGAFAGGALVALLEPGFGREAALRGVYLIAALGMGAMFAYGLARLRLPAS